MAAFEEGAGTGIADGAAGALEALVLKLGPLEVMNTIRRCHLTRSAFISVLDSLRLLQVATRIGALKLIEIYRIKINEVSSLKGFYRCL